MKRKKINPRLAMSCKISNFEAGKNKFVKPGIRPQAVGPENGYESIVKNNEVRSTFES